MRLLTPRTMFHSRSRPHAQLGGPRARSACRSYRVISEAPPCSGMMKVAVSLVNSQRCIFAANPSVLDSTAFDCPNAATTSVVSQRNSQYWYRCVLERCELAAPGPALGSPLKPRRGWCRRRSRRITVLGQQPIQAALEQLIAHQQQHVIESALPILTPQRHTPILSAHPNQPGSGTPKPRY